MVGAAAARRPGRGELVPAKAVDAIPRSASEAAARRRCHPNHAGRAVSAAGLASALGRRQAKNAGSLASKRVPTLLALEVEDARTTPNSCGSAPIDRSDGGSECDVGRGAHCCGTPRETWHPSVAANGQALHAFAEDATDAAPLASVEHVRSESCAVHSGVRLLRRRHRHVSDPVRLRRVGGRHSPNRALERDGASHGRLDGATVPNDRVRRPAASLRLHDRDSIYSGGVDRSLAAMGLTVLRTPVCAPQANAFCERLVGTIRRECLDFMIPLNERHLRLILQQWVAHYNRGRPHASLGPGLPDPPPGGVAASNDHRRPEGHRVVATPIQGGLHHEYRVEPNAA